MVCSTSPNRFTAQDAQSEGSAVSEESIDSVTESPAPKGRERDKELMNLRRMVDRDRRFGATLETTCNAVHRTMESGDAAPVLSMLADLVWRSLCIAWDVDTAESGIPKAQLRAQIAQLEDELKQLKSDFESCRSSYFKELISLRDQIRRLDRRWAAEIAHLVYVEEPVMFYEPLQFFSERVREHVAEIVEEKLKLLLTNLWRQAEANGVPMDFGAREAAGVAREAAGVAEARASEMEALAAAAHSRATDLQTALAQEQARHKAASLQYESEISMMLGAAGREWEALTDFAASRGVAPLLPALPRAPELARTAPATPCEPGQELSMHLQRFAAAVGEAPSSALDSGATSVVDLSKSVPCRASGRASGRSSGRASGYLEDLLRAGAETREQLLNNARNASLAEEANARKALLAEEANARKALLAEEANARKASLAEAANARKASLAEEALAAAESSAVSELAATEKSLRSSLSNAMNESAASAASHRRAVAELAALEEASYASLERSAEAGAAAQRLAVAEATEHAAANKFHGELQDSRTEVQRLQLETQRLKGIIEELLADPGKKRAPSTVLHWRTPTEKVFTRLFQDAVSRKERRESAPAPELQPSDEDTKPACWTALLCDATEVDEAQQVRPPSKRRSNTCAQDFLGSAAQMCETEKRLPPVVIQAARCDEIRQRSSSCGSEALVRAVRTLRGRRDADAQRGAVEVQAASSTEIGLQAPSASCSFPCAPHPAMQQTSGHLEGPVLEVRDESSGGGKPNAEVHLAEPAEPLPTQELAGSLSVGEHITRNPRVGNEDPRRGSCPTTNTPSASSRESTVVCMTEPGGAVSAPDVTKPPTLPRSLPTISSRAPRPQSCGRRRPPETVPLNEARRSSGASTAADLRPGRSSSAPDLRRSGPSRPQSAVFNAGRQRRC